MLEKKQFNIVPQEIKTFLQGKQEVEVIPYISPSNQLTLIRDYIERLYTDGNLEDNYMIAEWNLTLGITDFQTNISVINEGDISLELLLSSGLWEKILNELSNYYEFRINLDKIISEINSRKSVGVVLDKLSDRIFEFLEKLSSIDFSEEGINRLIATLKGTMKEFNEKWGSPTPQLPKAEMKSASEE